MPTPQFVRTNTVLPVSDIAMATAWYEYALGFETVYLHEGCEEGEATNYAILMRDGLQVHLILDEPPPYRFEWTIAGRGYLYLLVRDVQTIYEEVKTKNAVFTDDLHETTWGATGFRLTDPDGNHIYIEQIR